MKTEKIDVDGTRIIDGGMPKYWRCPQCKKLQKSGNDATEILIEYGKYIEHCEECGRLHYWELKLTDQFKVAVVEEMMRRIERNE